ncbi:MAG: FecR family protein [Verrucomicrobia bacterium]|nr:FecR family protein [Verrucomicrobiota bacterium]
MSIYLKFDLRICWCLCLALVGTNLIGQKVDRDLVRGVVIIAAKDGQTSFRDSLGKILPAETVPLGAVLPKGCSAQTGVGGRIVLLLSNGTVMTLESDTKLKLNEFSQKSFDPAGRKLSDLIAEPSKSNVKLNLEWGSIVVATKKLDRESSLTIQTQSGIAGIRGTQFQMSQNPKTGCKLDVTESTVNFTPKGGGQPIAISEGKGFDISTTGASKLRPVDPAAAQHIATTNAKALQSTGGVSLNSVNEAISDGDSEDSGSEKDTENNTEEAETPAEKQTSKENARGASTASLEANSANSTPSPPDDPTPPPLANSFSYDADSGILTIPGKLETLQGVGITQSNLAGLGVESTKSKAIPYLVDAFELGNFSGSLHASRFNEILLEAVNLMNILIKSLEMTDQLNVAGSENLFDKDRLTEILDNRNPYFHQLVKVLANKGAFGDKNDGKVGDAIGKLLLSLFPAGATSTEVSDLLSNTLGELVFQKLSGNLGDLVDLTEFEDSQLFKMKADQVKGIVAQDIHLGSTSETTTIIDLTKQLKPSSLSPTNPKDWKVFGIGAGKDIVVKGNVSFKNSNRHPQSDNVVKDHALAIGALDEIHFHSKTIEADWGLPADFLEKHLDYSVAEPQTTANDPTTTTFRNRTDRIKMEFEGANLYLGSISKMELVNVDLESGGNLGVASLDELHIVSSDPTNTPNTFTVGKNTNPSDRGDNVQLFANERIVADGLRFEGRVDSIYMEARTVDLKNVTFPHGSEVKLASKLGGVDGKYPTFGISQREIGRVNFIDNVKYDILPIANRDSFDALGTLLNGKQPITISKR